MAHADDALPIPDYDALPTATLQHRIRTLTRDQLGRVRDYETAHADRTAVTTLLDARLRELDAGAQPSGGSPASAQPEKPVPESSGSPVSPQTAGPKVNPPSHGVPSNPAQPRSTG